MGTMDQPSPEVSTTDPSLPTASGPRRPAVDSRLALGGMLVVAAVLRFGLLGRSSLTFDEIYLVKIALSGWPDILSVLRTAEFHPPLHYLVVKLWIGIAGFSETAIRMPSACFSLASVLLTYALLRRVTSEPVSLLGALFVAVAPFEVMAGQVARMYPLFGALTLASTLSLSYSVENGRAGRWAVYTAAVAAMTYTHYLGVFVVIAHGVWLALYERPHLKRWGAAVTVVAILFLPWVPSVVAQTARVQDGWADDVSIRDVTHLFGLFAFGGSLVGMPSFTFHDTALGLGQQGLLLLPFLVLVWRGVAGLAADRRRLAFLALPLAVPLLGTLAASSVKPFFQARWFSFLFPFYAAFLAQGVLEAAGHFRGHRAPIAAALTGALLLYSVPVLDRYYRDPRFHPYQWRERAAYLQTRVRPGDFILYGTDTNAIAFTYYFGVSHPGMALYPHPNFAVVRRLAKRYPRVWLVVAPPFRDTLLEETLPQLEATFTLVGRTRVGRPPVFPAVYLFEAKPLAPGATQSP